METNTNIAATTSASSIDSALLSAMRDNRERINLLKLERTLLDFMRDEDNTVLELNCQRYTSFHRLVLHRLADRFEIVREISTPSNGNIMLVKTGQSKVPTRLLIDLEPSEYNYSKCTGMNNDNETSGNGSVAAVANAVSGLTEGMASASITGPQSVGADGGKKKMMIMKRGKGGSNGQGERNSRNGKGRRGGSKAKNLSEKEKAYEEARARIFGVNNTNECNNSNVGDEGNANLIPDGNTFSNSPHAVSTSNCSSSPSPEYSVTGDSNDETTTKHQVKNGKVNSSNTSKVTWRNRKEEEADPDFRRRTAIPVYTGAQNYGIGWAGTGQSPHVVMQQAAPTHPSLYVYSRDDSSSSQNQVAFNRMSQAHNMHLYGSQYPQGMASLSPAQYKPSATTNLPSQYHHNAYGRPQDMYQPNDRRKQATANVHSQEEFPALNGEQALY
mmetsp:Transcript_18302/g.23733  ORF Transcript_18302/g.23733 Transcript_18302/m.23733 type:complete len:443 (+) Transcript_18302:481-1809(+)